MWQPSKHAMPVLDDCRAIAKELRCCSGSIMAQRYVEHGPPARRFGGKMGMHSNGRQSPAGFCALRLRFCCWRLLKANRARQGRDAGNLLHVVPGSNMLLQKVLWHEPTFPARLTGCIALLQDQPWQLRGRALRTHNISSRILSRPPLQTQAPNCLGEQLSTSNAARTRGVT